MKYLIAFILVALSFQLLSCSTCDGEYPSVILLNNGSDKADIQVETNGGNTIINIDSLLVGDQSEKMRLNQGDIEIVINIQGVEDPIDYSLEIVTCRDYIVNITPDNSVSVSESERD